MLLDQEDQPIIRHGPLISGMVKQFFEEEKFTPNPGHKPGFLPNFLNDLGVKMIIAGGMGDGAVQIFNGHGIEVITGVSGRNDEVVRQYLQGNLASSGSICHEHSHADSCGEH